MKKAEETATYLGSRGYTILKDNLEISDLILIRKELTVAPFVPKTSLAKPSPFPIYRESKKKIYLPRFYGLENYGEPEEIRLNPGKDINLDFKGQLRDYQKEIIKTWFNKTRNTGCGLIEADCGAGKTVMAADIIAKLNKKTLIIVHKDFLLRQWKERIEQFLPDAKIGLIQGPTIDIENKDIVIGMLQSLSMKDYENDVFKDFGLTIVDEAHHISAEVFSRVLFKAVTKYMLGLSATMERPDGLTRVFKMFMGDIAARWKREAQSNVMVRALEYISKDEEHNYVEKNYRGQTDYVKMIGKISDCSHRTEFILKMLEDTWRDSTDKQIMIIGHRKTQLAYIHDAIKQRGFATVGYYIGGMKERDLKITESKNIVVATYKMAEEALDIKTLTTIVMASPKKDVRQAVGRILRSKGDKLVIDIIDQHTNFKKHWIERRKWYNRQEFKIYYTTTEDYNKGVWKQIENKKCKPLKVKTEPYENILIGKCLIGRD